MTKNKHLIEIAYEYAKDNFGKTPFTFKELFDALLKKDSSVKNEASDLYLEILQDIRFLSLGKQKWSLRENFTINEVHKITSSMFGLDEYHEEDADKYMSDSEKKEQIKKEETEDFSDFIDADDDDRDNAGSSSSDDENDDIEKSDDFDDDNTTDDVDDVELEDDEETEIDEDDLE